MLNILFLILGTAISHRGGRRCRTEIVDVAQQDADLTDLLIPFTGAASEGDDTSDGGDDVTDGTLVTLSTASTTCMMRGLSRSWPHEDAEPEIAQRRLLRRGRKSKVKFDVDNAVVGVLNKKNRGDYTCYNDGTVGFAFKSADIVLSTDAAQAGDPRRSLRRGGHGGHGHHGGHHDSSSSDSEEEAEPAPYATLVLTQTNSFADADGAVVPASFDLTMTCRPWYRLDDVADGEDETCSVRGLRCYEGSYSYFSTDSGEEQEEESKWFQGMKCSTEDDFHADWDECVAV